MRFKAALPVLLAAMSLRSGFVGASTSVEAPTALLYAIEDHFTVTDIDPKTKQVRLWLELPLEDEWQTVKNLKVSSPVPFTIKKDSKTPNRFLYIKTKNVQKLPLEISVSFTLERKSYQLPNPSSTETKLKNYRQYLAPLPYIPVDAMTKKLAQSILGQEQDKLKQTQKIYEYIQNNSTYYRKEPNRLKPSGVGSALYCLNEKTGNCTDFHALFMSLTRSVGIPSEFLMGSWLSKEKEGKEDPGYHCWVKFFNERHGWVAADAAFGNLWPEKRDFYFGNLDAQRVAFTQGRSINLAPQQKGQPLNYFLYGYAEADGKPGGKIQRKLIFRSLNNL